MRFGAVVAELVDGVTKLDQIKFKSREEAQAESFRKMLLAMVRDLRVILVKLADRTHNMRTIEAMAPARRRAIARETLEIYAPIAERLGLYSIKLELEDLGFKALYPRRYQVLERTLRRARGNQKEFLKKIEQQLNAALAKSNIQAQVLAREKHLYSIYSKMRRKRAILNEIVDVYGIRIVVDTPDTCYRALGAVHSVFKPKPGSPRTGNTRPAAMPSPASRSAPASGCRTWCRFRRRAPPRSSWRASRSTCSPTRCTCSRPRARSCACPREPRSWISPTRSTPTSAIAASPPRSTGA